ncbi:type IV toxin-antitoxin system AbiEi family antitoxin domain-containing protein [Frankia sp. CNm7]|uniref:Type IV toxin-antitoxin system AbiEi family antitoxin domain-containing protein n=2 Tax=Frankia nepalensis TaxID=1836974 RepID=A0A937RNB7_9ACTN|nr:type IV toxin-antitoxin system AbiEi family antitoxin domain-containing protein [Frankia nepalensis]MBL7524228.1 type IV toxin-antitoxin system AbiEi family antitoxin domain-containing protein [Frankia nepalensis]MBL7629603.1 type IV toxin-antitoxin system AbiEi family antitoxin domain-containing protein [Frankia nepalensis]
MLLAGRVARAQNGAITYRQALEAGLTREQIRQFVARGWWYSPCRGSYVIRAAAGAADSEGDLRARAQAAPAGRPGAVIGGITAARLLGLCSHALPPLTADEPVHLLVARRGAIHPARGVRIGFAVLRADEVATACGLPVTAPVRTLADLVLGCADRGEAVSFMDAALRSGCLDGLDVVRAAAAGRPGRSRAEQWWSLADGRSESVLETRTRLVLVSGGLPPEQLQWLVCDKAGVPVARIDLAYPSRRVAVEADGARFHGGVIHGGVPRGGANAGIGALDRVEPVFRDRKRQNALSGLDWTIVRVTWSDVLERPSEVIADVRGALNRRAA